MWDSDIKLVEAYYETGDLFYWANGVLNFRGYYVNGSKDGYFEFKTHYSTLREIRYFIK